MIDQNVKGYLDIYNIKKIDDILYGFEKEYQDKLNKKGKKIIKEEYKIRLVRKRG